LGIIRGVREGDSDSLEINSEDEEDRGLREESKAQS
jgi:hypothetical protein